MVPSILSLSAVRGGGMHHLPLLGRAFAQVGPLAWDVLSRFALGEHEDIQGLGKGRTWPEVGVISNPPYIVPIFVFLHQGELICVIRARLQGMDEEGGRTSPRGIPS